MKARNTLVNIMQQTFASINENHPKSLPTCVQLSLGQLAPVHEGMELGVGSALILNSIAEVSGMFLLLVRATGSLFTPLIDINKLV